RITARLIGAIVPRLEAREHERLKAEPIGEPDAYALTLAGVRSLRQWTKPGINRGLRLFRQAIAAHREVAPAYAMESYCYVQQQAYGWFADSQCDRAEGVAFARAAADLGADNALISPERPTRFPSWATTSTAAPCWSIAPSSSIRCLTMLGT